FITPYIIDVENKAEEFAEIEEERPLPAETEKLAVNRVNPEEKVEKPDKLQEEKAAVPVDDKHINPSVEEKTAVEKEKQLPVSAADKNPEKELQLLTLDEIREVVKLREPGSRPKDTAANKKAEIIVPLENKEPSKGIVVEEQYAEEKKETTEYEAGSTKPAIDLGKYYLFSYELTKEITIKELAELFNVQEELIQEANKGRSFSVGSSIYIPVDESRIYIINKGDTLWKIHKMFNVEIEDIKKLNNIIDETNISVGTAIVIPQ
ncbi:MAG: LysM peptidoglycan-binding domain-containing protein, partial [Halanaerobiaceae bacterium]|nr:LysM peptidoglycan-binding domain-containing protein [Halanaerobiaceae bacterium]